jgi:hypothetical protein
MASMAIRRTEGKPMCTLDPTPASNGRRSDPQASFLKLKKKLHPANGCFWSPPQVGAAAPPQGGFEPDGDVGEQVSYGRARVYRHRHGLSMA